MTSKNRCSTAFRHISSDVQRMQACPFGPSAGLSILSVTSTPALSYKSHHLNWKMSEFFFPLHYSLVFAFDDFALCP